MTQITNLEDYLNLLKQHFAKLLTQKTDLQKTLKEDEINFQNLTGRFSEKIKEEMESYLPEKLKISLPETKLSMDDQQIFQILEDLFKLSKK